MECPRCGLINPDTAQRCDCGYDFETKTVEKPYYEQGLPNDIRTYVILAVILNVTSAYRVVSSGVVEYIVVMVVWSVAVWWLYSQFIAKKDWARLALIILTLPVGLYLAHSREARLYSLQK